MVSAMSVSVLIAAMAAHASANPQFVARIPNGANVDGVQALGHVNPSGGGARNAFGTDFKANELKWTTELCQKDSDGDGQTNGEELGDPCCEWSVDANDKLKWTEGVSSPGDAKSMTDAALLKNVTCASTPAPSSNAVGSSVTVFAVTVTATAAAALVAA